MSDLSQLSRAELENRKADLVRRRQQSTDDNEKRQLREQIRAIDNEVERRDLEDGQAANDRVDRATDALDEIQNRNPNDALSAGVRGARGLREELGSDKDD